MIYTTIKPLNGPIPVAIGPFKVLIALYMMLACPIPIAIGPIKGLITLYMMVAGPILNGI